MARPAPRWANVEKKLVAWLQADVRPEVFTELPSNLNDVLPAHRITRVGGGDGAETTKVYQVEIETYASTRGQLWDAVADVETSMRRLAANGLDGLYVDEVTETFAAALVEHEGDGVRKATATYGIAVRPATITTT